MAKNVGEMGAAVDHL